MMKMNLINGFTPSKILFNQEDVLFYYEHIVINTNLKNLLLNGGSLYYVEFLSLDQIHDRHRPNYKWTWDNVFRVEDPCTLNNPFLRNWEDVRQSFLRSLLSNGLYFPLFVDKIDGKYYIREGHHRFSALKIALAEGCITSMFKVMCLIIPEANSTEDLNISPTTCFKLKTQGNILSRWEVGKVDTINDLFQIYWDSDRLVGKQLSGLDVPYLEYLQSEEAYCDWISTK